MVRTNGFEYIRVLIDVNERSGTMFVRMSVAHFAFVDRTILVETPFMVFLFDLWLMPD